MSFVVLAHWRARPGEEEHVAEVLEELMPASRAEPSCLFYQPHRVLDDPTLFIIYEEYTDRAGLDAHRDSPHFQRLAANDAIPRLAERTVTFCEKL
ncbi:MAG: hypothetical protein QOF51_92 [Chloroflexota bacterium]|jgi:quinol monooxygenase YgiN|nr:hypothetical protein [Chloroflexota bacterium]